MIFIIHLYLLKCVQLVQCSLCAAQPGSQLWLAAFHLISSRFEKCGRENVYERPQRSRTIRRGPRYLVVED